MKVAIDATTLLLRSAGVKNYMYYWLAALRAAATPEGSDVHLATFPPRIGASDVLDHESSSRTAASAQLRLRLVQFCNIAGNPLRRLLLSGVDVFHASQHTAHRPGKIPTTATIFDLSCWTTPASHTPQNVAATRRYARKILQDADGLIAISAHARGDAVEILGIPEERIRVIQPGVADAFFEVSPGQVAESRTAYGLPARYLLFVGCIEPRKNIPHMVQAYQRIPEAVRREVPLVVAGPRGWACAASFESMAAAGQAVRYLGYVPEGALPGLVSGAAALIYPSYYEGFGLPVAQAMAAGVPVVASNRSCLPEVVQDAGLLADPDSLEELAHAMERVLCEPGLADTLAARGRERSGAFRWSRCARESIEFFRGVGGR